MFKSLKVNTLFHRATAAGSCKVLSNYIRREERIESDWTYTLLTTVF